ncbi:Sec23/Sec24 trunk domain-containing protein [Neocallimastix lanati (nom. inval.)]|uniref:Uncharacterized protein n=1 Tax=Neocallimastix californiae TaxID=1754190 RepID=A0A1Y2ESX1_9FUNG|nr:Sec23/Sec24 trunk domain-containing protein [Neocallimastix sp. JGI-2020a]ORY74663.1 hypothetical protein LY90DRAFT_401782 [Neocallimastix californiae]|eukprot:ORY74663.1 hypothetical protein LY90DRAFT_401782 [Neocallimastix californiae]
MQQPPQPQQPQPQQKPQSRSRIDPNQVPNPISVEGIDQELYNQQPYLTSSKSMPPLVSTEVKVIDDGNCSPRFMRLTSYNIPSSEDLLNSSMLPLGLIIQPLAEVPPYEEPIPLIDNGETGPIRCRRCKGYINPGVAFVDGGRRFICNICGCDNVVSDEYFCNLDMNGKRCDLFRRPELTHGTVEYVATKDFMERDPVPITYVFVIDVSFSASMNGLISKTCEALKGMFSQEVSQFPPGARVGFITYDRNVYFYNIKAELDQPQQLIVPDVDDIFIPINDGFLVDIENSKKNIIRLLDILPSMFENNHINDHSLGAAFQAATLALKPTGGKVCLFASSIPSYGPGTLRVRQDNKLLGTDKERSLYEPQDNWYKQIAQKCATGGITVDTFLLPTEFIDVATVGILSTLTGGKIFFYPQFDQTKDSIRYINDIIYSLRRSFGYDALLRVRASDGLRVEEYLGNFHMTNSTDLELSGLSSDTAFGVTIKYDFKLNDNLDSAFQCALLYTSVTGQRRIRIHTLTVSSTSLLGDVFKYSELDTTLNYLVKQAVNEMFNQPLKNVREHLTDECVKILTSYRRHCATSTAPGQLILPESFKLLPLFNLCILKLEAFRTDPYTPDIRVNNLRLLGNLNTSTLMSLLYPKIYNLSNLSEVYTSGNIKLPNRVRAYESSIESNGIYLLENGLQMILWIGHSVSPQYIKDIFNVESIDKVDSRMHLLPILNNPNSMKIRAILAKIQSKNKSFLELKIIRNQIDSLMDIRFNNSLVEDKTTYMSYVEYLCYIHKHIQNEISNS